MSNFLDTIRTSIHQQNLFGQGPPSYSPLPVEDVDTRPSKSNDLENQVSQIQLQDRESIEGSLERTQSGSDEFVGPSSSTSTFSNRAQATNTKTPSSSRSRLSYSAFVIINLFTYLILTLIGLSTSTSGTLQLLAVVLFLSVGMFLLSGRILQYLSPETFEGESVLPAMRLYFQFAMFEFIMVSLSITFLLGRIVSSDGLVLTIFLLLGLGIVAAVIGAITMAHAADCEKEGKSGRVCGF